MILVTKPLISVVIPVYNVEKYLEACMESVTAQTYENLQIILVDDGTKDRSDRICDAWAERDGRVQVIHQQNRGLSGARNTGIEAAEGEYILFVDSDDVISPHLCQTLLDALGEGDIAICDPVHVFPGKDWEYTLSDRVVAMDPTDAICTMWYQTGFLPSAWGKLYRRSLWQTRRFTEGRLFEDIDIMHELLYAAKTVAYTPACLYGYLHREDSITTKKFSVRDLDILLIADKILDFAKDKPSLMRAAKAYAVTAGLRVCLNAPKKPELAQGIAKAGNLVKTMGREVLTDRNIRRKNRLALQLYFTCKPLMRLAYRFVNRWK